MYRLLSFSGILGLTFLTASIIFTFTLPVQSAAITDREEIEKILGQGQLRNGILVIVFSRGDIQARAGGEPVPEGLGLRSRTVWKRIGHETMVLGSLVLLEREINPAISALEAMKIEITALHRYPFSEEPRLMALHIYGVGKPDILAQGIKNALAPTGTMDAPKPVAAAVPLHLDTKRIEKITGVRGQTEGGVFKILEGREDVSLLGISIPPEIGTGSWAGFFGSNERAHLAGEISVTASEVNSVSRVLRKNGIDILGLNHKFLDEDPRIFFLQYRGTGPLVDLAKAIREAFAIVRESAGEEFQNNSGAH